MLWNTKKQPGWAGLIGLAAQVANVGSMGAQSWGNRHQMELIGGGSPLRATNNLAGQGHREYPPTCGANPFPLPLARPAPPFLGLFFHLFFGLDFLDF